MQYFSLPVFLYQVKLIELLMKQWYIDRHEQEQLYSDIIGIDKTKQAERKKTE